VALVGGNIARSPRVGPGQAPGPLMIDVTAIGSVKIRRVLTRGGARPGDEVFVTGTIGARPPGCGRCRAKAGGRTKRSIFGRAARPCGRAAGPQRAATACIDLSDGLADGLRQLAAGRPGAYHERSR